MATKYAISKTIIECNKNLLKEQEAEDWRSVQSILYDFEKGMSDEQIEDHISNLQSHIQQLIYIMNNR